MQLVWGNIAHPQKLGFILSLGAKLTSNYLKLQWFSSYVWECAKSLPSYYFIELLISVGYIIIGMRRKHV